MNKPLHCCNDITGSACSTDKGSQRQGKANTEDQPDDKHALPKGGSCQGSRVVVAKHHAVSKLYNEVSHLGTHSWQSQFDVGSVMANGAIVVRVYWRAAGSNRDGGHSQGRL